MISSDFVTQNVSERVAAHAALIAQFANLCIAAHPDSEALMANILRDTDFNAETIQLFRKSFIEICDYWGYTLPQDVVHQIWQIALPAEVAALPPPMPTRHQHADKHARLRELRTGLATINGERLAQAATAMNGWFHWVKSGPRVPGFAGQAGMVYGPKTQWTHTQTDSGVDVHPQKQNDFARWLLKNKPAPNRHAHMNCWEAVLFSAFRAGLIDKARLKIVHLKAAQAYEIQHKFGAPDAGPSSSHYYLALSHAFNFFASAPFEPHAGLIPRKGDILFWGRDDHLAISLGRTWADGTPTDRMMSLWHHAGGTFATLTILDMPAWMQSDFKFVPCPF